MAKSTGYVAHPVSLGNVQLTDGFWKTRQDVNRTVTLPMEHQQCLRTGRIDAFKLDWKPGQPNRPHEFWDSDLGKWIEAAGYSLALTPDPQLQKVLDDVIDLVVSAQHPDGYLNLFYTVVEPGKRWTNLRDKHELYCAGHLMEAAVAYFQGTGNRKLLDCMCRYADHIAETFGPAEGQKRGYCGHPEIELALVKLYRCSNEKRYLDLANFFVTERGRSNPHYFDVERQARGENNAHWAGLEYYQADKPLLDQKTLEGHAVRALYLLSGAIDVAAETGNAKLLAACKRLYSNAVRQRMYITGAVGSARHGERFTFDYDLPNETAYAETCANIALVLASHRLLQLEADAVYADIMERALYNGVVSGVSLKGDRFYYANPLTADQEAISTGWGVISAKRQEWFDCACCPPNIARMLASFNQYIYSTGESTVHVHLYTSCQATIDLAGQRIGLSQQTQYPWDETIRLTVRPEQPAKFTLALRIPGWCETAAIQINGKTAKPKLVRGYAILERLWQASDRVELVLSMPVRLMETNPRCRNNAGKVAVQRGPLVYCAEEVDNGSNLAALVLPLNTKFKARFEPKLLDGVVTLTGKAYRRDDRNWGQTLYRPAGGTKLKPVLLKLVPYCLWSNRKVGRMQVWLSCQNNPHQPRRN